MVTSHREASLLLAVVAPLALATSAALAAPPGAGRDEPRIVGPDTLAMHWTAVEPMAPVTYPPDLAARKVTGCVTLAYVIEADGHTSDFRTLEAAASSRSPLAKAQAIEQFAKSAAGTVAQWRFQAKDEPRRTLTATTVQYDDSGATSATQCGNGDLARALQKGKNWDRALRDLYEAKSRYWTAPQNERQPSAFIK